MNQIALGDSGAQVSALCLGTMFFGTTVDEPTSFRLLDRYYDAGGRFLDTADIYAFWVDGGEGGESESLLGRWMEQRGNRDELFLATKVGAAPGRRPDRRDDPPRRGGEPAPPEDRPHRPLLRAQGRPLRPARGDRRRIRRAGRRRDGPPPRLQQHDGVADRARPRDRGRRPVLLRPAAPLLPAPAARAPASRASSPRATSCSTTWRARASRCSPTPRSSPAPTPAPTARSRTATPAPRPTPASPRSARSRARPARRRTRSCSRG